MLKNRVGRTPSAGQISTHLRAIPPRSGMKDIGWNTIASNPLLTNLITRLAANSRSYIVVLLEPQATITIGFLANTRKGDLASAVKFPGGCEKTRKNRPMAAKPSVGSYPPNALPKVGRIRESGGGCYGSSLQNHAFKGPTSRLVGVWMIGGQMPCFSHRAVRARNSRDRPTEKKKKKKSSRPLS